MLSRIGIRDFTFWDEFLEIFEIFGKPDPETPRGWLFGKGRIRNLEKWGKVWIYGTNYSFYLNFQDFDLILGSPRGWSKSWIFQNVKNFQNQDFVTFHKNEVFKMWFFFENERACMCVWIVQKFAITYTYTWFVFLC